MTTPENPTDETVAVDNDVEQTSQGAPAGDDGQETAVDAFAAADEADTVGEDQSAGGQ